MSGCLIMFRYQVGFFGAPPRDATSRTPSLYGTYITGFVRLRPVTAPVIVTKHTSRPCLLFPMRPPLSRFTRTCVAASNLSTRAGSTSAPSDWFDSSIIGPVSHLLAYSTPPRSADNTDSRSHACGCSAAPGRCGRMSTATRASSRSGADGTRIPSVRFSSQLGVRLSQTGALRDLRLRTCSRRCCCGPGVGGRGR